MAMALRSGRCGLLSLGRVRRRGELKQQEKVFFVNASCFSCIQLASEDQRHFWYLWDAYDRGNCRRGEWINGGWWMVDGGLVEMAQTSPMQQSQ